MQLPLAAGIAQGQSLEPGSYSNAPVGLNFLIAGYAEGKIAFDPSTAISDANFYTHAEVFAYARTLDAWGQSAMVWRMSAMAELLPDQFSGWISA